MKNVFMTIFAFLSMLSTASAADWICGTLTRGQNSRAIFRSSLLMTSGTMGAVHVGGQVIPLNDVVDNQIDSIIAAESKDVCLKGTFSSGAFSEVQSSFPTKFIFAYEIKKN